MKYLALFLLLLAGCDQISKKDCFKSCNILCDERIEGQKEIDLLTGCEIVCGNITAPCAKIGAVNEWGQNETVTYCLYVFHECRKTCLKKFLGEE